MFAKKRSLSRWSLLVAITTHTLNFNFALKSSESLGPANNASNIRCCPKLFKTPMHVFL